MKKTSLVSVLLSATLTASLLAGCSSSNGSEQTSAESTAATTEAPVVTTDPNEHLHLDPVVYPDALDFNDTESIERIFDMCEVVDGVRITVEKRMKQIRMRAKINGETFTLNVNLSGAAGHTTPEQLATVAKLFWYCYPQMYARFAVRNTPTTVTIKFEDSGYEIASASGDEIHIHDQWLKNHPTDYDCLTHELAHIIQSGWDGNYCPAHTNDDGSKDTYMIERFADYCRYLYAFKGGYYNDMVWEIQTVKTENTYYKSVRFYAWLDYTYSTQEIDIMQRLQKAVTSKTYGNDAWEPDGEAWQAMFEGTAAAGKSLTTLWDEFAASDIAGVTSKPREQGGKSTLLLKAPLRTAVRDRYPEADDYLKVQ
ncbi:MAG: hypothetical protein IJX47_07325 [Clostridia bacterium]|nr:hypothetical protein [Clostridia bacterium]